MQYTNTFTKHAHIFMHKFILGAMWAIKRKTCMQYRVPCAYHLGLAVYHQRVILQSKYFEVAIMVDHEVATCIMVDHEVAIMVDHEVATCIMG